MNPKAVLLLTLAVYAPACGTAHMSATPGATSGSPTDSTWNAAFESKIEALRLRYHIPGLSAGVVYQGKLVWKKGFGYADVANKVAPDEHTVYQIASLTKTFGSIILMQQVEAGRSAWTTPFKNTASDWAAAGAVTPASRSNTC
jgi:CubicO group peptidase (beta-lactamase class C family)